MEEKDDEDEWEDIENVEEEAKDTVQQEGVTTTMKSEFEVWADKEEQSVASHPAPPLWDENILDIHQHSFVLGGDRMPGFKKMVLDWTNSDTSPNESIDTQTGSLYFHLAIKTGDIPFLKCMGRYNANYNIGERNTGRTALILIIIMMRSTGRKITIQGEVDRTLSNRRDHIDTLRWLLSRGADPKLRCAIYRKSPLEYAIEPARGEHASVDIEVCKLLIDYGAETNASILGKCSNNNIKKQLLQYALTKRVKPILLCPCGNDVSVDQCHGAKNCVPLHPRMYCHCLSGKKYDKCCLRRRHFHRETLGKWNNLTSPQH